MGQYFEVDAAGLVHFRQKGTEQLVLEQGTVLPVNGITGQIFWKTDTTALKIHNGVTFQSVGAWLDSGTVLTLPSPGRLVEFSDGSAVAPSITFQTQTNKGLFNPGSNLLGVAINGTEVARFDSSGNFQISNSGQLIISSASGTYPRLLSTAGEMVVQTQGFTRLTVGYNGGVTLATGQVVVPNGAVGAPSYSYSGDLTTGHYRDATYLNSVVAGVAILRVGSSHVEAINGTVGNPAYSFMNSVHAGAYLVSADIIAWSTASTEALRIDATQNLLASGLSISLIKSNSGGNQIVSVQNTSNTASSGAILQTVAGGASGGDSFTQYSITGGSTWACGIDNSDGDKFKISVSSYPGTNDYLIIDPISGVVSMPNTTFSANQVLAVNGTFGAPSISFANSNTSGWYRYGGDQIGLSLAGTARWYYSTDQMVALRTSCQVISGNGAIGAPAFALYGSLTTGLYQYGTDQLGITVAGTGRWYFSADQIAAQRTGCQIIGGNGAVGAPSFALYGSLTTGLYQYGTDQLGITVAGTGRWFFNGNTMAAIQAGSQIQMSAGSVGNPSFTFSATPSYGMWYGSGYVRITAGGSDSFIFGATNYSYVNLLPISDNNYTCGGAGARWSEMRATNVYTGDIHLENGWTITEGDKVGRDKDEIILLSPTGKKFKFLVTEVV